MIKGIGKASTREILYLFHITKFSGFVGKRSKTTDKRRSQEREVISFVPRDALFVIGTF